MLVLDLIDVLVCFATELPQNSNPGLRRFERARGKPANSGQAPSQVFQHLVCRLAEPQPLANSKRRDVLSAEMAEADATLSAAPPWARSAPRDVRESKRQLSRGGTAPA